jgi:hypothetical protein
VRVCSTTRALNSSDNQSQGTTSQLGEKTQSKALCNKGTVSAGPIISAKRSGAFSPCHLAFHIFDAPSDFFTKLFSCAEKASKTKGFNP